MSFSTSAAMLEAFCAWLDGVTDSGIVVFREPWDAARMTLPSLGVTLTSVTDEGTPHRRATTGDEEVIGQLEAATLTVRAYGQTAADALDVAGMRAWGQDRPTTFGVTSTASRITPTRLAHGHEIRAVREFRVSWLREYASDIVPMSTARIAYELSTGDGDEGPVSGTHDARE